MKQQQQQQQNLNLQRSTSTNTTTRNNRRIIPSNFQTSESDDDHVSNQLLIKQRSTSSQQQQQQTKPTSTNKLSSLIRSFLNIFTFQTIFPTCNWLTIPSTLSTSIKSPAGRKVTGTLFGHRRGHISFAIQLHPRAEPLLLLELAMSTTSLVKEMSSGLVRIALECRKTPANIPGGVRPRQQRLFHEPDWVMYCNGRKCAGYAVSRTCGDLDWHVLNTVQSVSVGAGVIPLLEDGGGCGSEAGELMYMRARFERVVGSRDSEAFYMLNPDGSGGPELSIFLLRI